jgi:hypothetical protein
MTTVDTTEPSNGNVIHGGQHVDAVGPRRRPIRARTREVLGELGMFL